MKLKYYLRGLGIGIVVTTLILMIAYKSKGSLSNAEIIAKAEALGMVMESATPDTLFTEGTTEDTTNLQTTDDTTEETTEKETETEKSTEPETEAPTEEPVTQSAVINSTITIKGGMYSNAVAQALQSSGIIADAQDFDKYLESTGYSEMIQTGDFAVDSSMSYETIAKIITRSN